VALPPALAELPPLGELPPLAPLEVPALAEPLLAPLPPAPVIGVEGSPELEQAAPLNARAPNNTARSESPTRVKAFAMRPGSCPEGARFFCQNGHAAPARSIARSPGGKMTAQAKNGCADPEALM
jgi:hypothetical protein